MGEPSGTHPEPAPEMTNAGYSTTRNWVPWLGGAVAIGGGGVA